MVSEAWAARGAFKFEWSVVALRMRSDVACSVDGCERHAFLGPVISQPCGDAVDQVCHAVGMREVQESWMRLASTFLD